jgi:hypothetical protein
MTASLADGLHGRMTGWTGLPAAADESVLTAAAGGTGAFRPGYAPRVATRYRVLDIAAPQLARAVSAWFRGDDPAALWIELEEPVALDLDALAPLGPPARELPSSRPLPGGPVREEVWPEQGVAVAIVEGEPPRVGWAALFRPMSFEDYLTSAGRPPQIRPSPL